jgi:hypothetical protein
MQFGDKVGYGLLIGTIVLAFTLIGCVVFSNKEIRGYYMQTTSTCSAVSYNIMNDINWAEDTVAFSTTDGDKAIEMLERLKGTINE